MSYKRLVLIVVFGVLFAAIAILTGVLVNDMGTEVKKVSLPEASEFTDDIPNQDADLSGDDAQVLVEVKPDTVRRVVAALERSDSYSRTLKSEMFWQGGSAIYEFDISINGENSSVTINDDKRIVIAHDKIYIWYDGDYSFYSGDVSDGVRMADEYQMLVTWEDIAALPDGAVEEAEYVEYGGENCIFVRFVSGTLEYETRCYISVVEGLVKSAEIYDGSTLIYRMHADDAIYGETDDSLFVLPDDTNVLNPA